MKKKVLMSKDVTVFDEVLSKHDKLIITLGSPYKGLIFSPHIRVWLKNRSGAYRQIGRIRKLDLSASVKKFFPKLSIVLPENHEGLSSVTRKNLVNNKRDLRRMGVKVIEQKLRLTTRATRKN